MSLTVAMNTALSGLFASQRAIAGTSENIANVNTPDYVRRQANFSTDSIPGHYAGVDVDIARAAVDRFLQGAAYGGNADAAGARAVAEGLARIDASLGAPGDNISFAHEFDRAFAALTTLAANPSSVAARAGATAALNAAFDAVARTRAALAEKIQGADARIALDIERANDLLEEIHRLNAVVPESGGAADLLDTRLSELSKLVSINVSRNEAGQAEVAAADGTVLASAGGYTAFGYAPQTGRLTLSAAGASGGSGEISDDFGAALGSGEIRGLLDLRNEELPRLDGVVAQAARDVADALNGVYADNVAVGEAAPDGAALIVEGADGFAVNPAILADPARLAVARLGPGGLGGANDGQGAAMLADLAASAAAGGLRQAVSLIGSAAQGAEQTAATNDALAAEISARVSAESGVNLDEELSNLIVYQRAYGANARVISAVDELWRTLLSIL